MRPQPLYPHEEQWKHYTEEQITVYKQVNVLPSGANLRLDTCLNGSPFTARIRRFPNLFRTIPMLGSGQKSTPKKNTLSIHLPSRCSCNFHRNASQKLHPFYARAYRIIEFGNIIETTRNTNLRGNVMNISWLQYVSQCELPSVGWK